MSSVSEEKEILQIQEEVAKYKAQMKAVQAKKQMDMLDTYKMDPRKTVEMLEEYIKATDTFKYFPEPSIVTPEDLINKKNKIQTEIQQLENRKEQTEKALDFVKNLNFSAGDAAFHKNYGNVLINGVTLNIENLENSSYSITTRNNGRVNVPISEIVPITEATKILYGKVK